jgi:hypothetical protein
MSERCAICGCELHRSGDYALPTPKGRSHATKHHYVAERFFGRSQNRRGTKREAIFSACPWNSERKPEMFCYECHEELMHNPVLLPNDIAQLAALVRKRGLSEDQKPNDRSKLAARIQLFHEIIACGLKMLSEQAADQAESITGGAADHGRAPVP